MQKKEHWMKHRHRVYTDLVRPFFTFFLKHKYGCTVIKDKTIKAPCLILYNHQTCMDQFMVGLIFKDQIYYMATEDLFSNGFSSKAITHMVKPIPKSKSVKDLGAIRNCLKIAKEGGNIGIAPEGNRTYSGHIGHIDVGIAKLAKSLKIDVVIVNIIGGYAVEPRWASKVRKAKMTCKVNCIIPKEEIAEMDSETLFKLIAEKMDVSPHETNLTSLSDIRAEKLERVLYICPICGKYSTLHSNGNYLKCDNCGMEVEYTENLTFRPKSGEFPFQTVYDWYRYQEVEICKTKSSDFDDNKIHDDQVTIKQVIVGKKKKFIATGNIALSSSTITFTSQEKQVIYPLEKITAIACLGKHKMNIFLTNQEIYQVIGQEDFNPVKYMQIYYHLTNLKGGITHDEFLGI